LFWSQAAATSFSYVDRLSTTQFSLLYLNDLKSWFWASAKANFSGRLGSICLPNML